VVGWSACLACYGFGFVVRVLGPGFEVSLV
jgi:hypothetical protein